MHVAAGRKRHGELGHARRHGKRLRRGVGRRERHSGRLSGEDDGPKVVFGLQAGRYQDGIGRS